MTINKLMTFAAFIVVITNTMACSMANKKTPPADCSQTVVVFDVWDYFQKEGISSIYEKADALYFITSLQGIVNRQKPSLYLIAALDLFNIETSMHYEKNFKQKPVRNLDKFWLDYFIEKGFLSHKNIIRTNDLEEVLSHYKTQLKGLVTWTMDVPATSNVALIAAGCDDLAPVSKDLDNGKFYKRIKNDFPYLKVKLSLCQRFDGKSDIIVDGKKFKTTKSAKNDAYKFAIEKYLKTGKSNPFKMWYNCDASMWGDFRSFYGGSNYDFLGDKNELQQNGMYNADYWVAQKAFFLDLLPWDDYPPKDDPTQPVGTDHKTWHDIMEVSYKLRKGQFGITGGFVPWWIKYTKTAGGKHDDVATEWEFVSILTSYNMGNDADAAFGIANSSFFQHMPKINRQQAAFSLPKKIEYEKQCTYLAILMMDYDGSAWLNQMVPSIYNDPARGKIVLNWIINPALNFRVPHAYRYIYENKTQNDYLGFSGDGAAYIQPMSLFQRNGRIEKPGDKYYIKFAKELNKRFGIEYNVFYIDDVFDEKWAKMAAQITPKGFGVNLLIGNKMINSTPVTQVPHYHISGRDKLRKGIADIFKDSQNNKSNQNHASFHALRCILLPPSMIKEAVDMAKSKYPNANVKLVDVDNYFKLLKHRLEK